jgi:protein-S-isoprenylcysteine O-methyltransferase Ste14
MDMVGRLARQWESPPTWLAFFVLVVWMQSRHVPVLPTGPALDRTGLALVMAGLALVIAAAVEFRRHQTTILPREVPRAMLTRGLYAWSRNPIYLGDAVLLAGVALMMDAAALVFVPVFMAVIARRFILGEEAGMRAVFGADFDAYAARVRRWI